MIKNKKSIINPFLVNPVLAVYNSQSIGIKHCYRTNKGVMLSIEIDGKDSQALLSDIAVLNDHELLRLKILLKELS